MADDTEIFEKRVGEVLKGKWTLERLLGVGGMAAVYVGVHKIGRRDAIKILHPEIARNKELRARFEQEARAVNQFRHPGAVEIRDIDVTEDGAPFLVMELLDGESLATRAEQVASFEVGEALRIVDAVLDVLAEAHAHGIIHRDIKPDNLFLLRDGRVKVLDFGIARMRQEAGASLKTQTGSMLGTVTYMPPEQVTGLKIDARADIFAVGATMFRLLARRRIHEANSEPYLLIKMATESAPPLASVAPHLPREVCLLVDRALAFQAAQRYPDARTMQSDVRDVLRGEMPRAALAFTTTGAFAVSAPVAGPPVAAFGPPSGAPTRAEWPAAVAPASASTPSRSSHATSPTVSGDAPTMMALGPPGPMPPELSPASMGGRASVAEARSAAQPASAGWPASTDPADVPSALTRLAAPPPARTEPSQKAIWIAAGIGAAVILVGITLVLTLSGGNDSATTALTSTPPGRRSRGAPGAKDKDQNKTKGSEEAWCGGGECDFECDSRCEMACTGGRCNIEVKRGGKVACGGSGECALWCEDDCSVKCPGEASCVVHCKPGKRCKIDVCPTDVKQCSNGIAVCGQRCPD